MKDAMLKALMLAANKLLSLYKLEVRQAELQRWVESKFPIRRENFVTLTLRDPIVKLEPEDDRIGIELTVRAEIGKGVAVEGRWLVDGEPAYDRDKGEFYLHNPAVRSVNPALFIQDSNPLTQGVNEAILGKIFYHLPVYTLKDDRLSHSLAKLLVKSIKVRGDRVIVELGLY